MMFPLWLTAPVALAASSTVSPGDDLQAAAASLAPGDTITFNSGVYELEGTVNWTAVGSAEAPVLLHAAPGAEVILRGIAGGYVAALADSQFVQLRGLTFDASEDREENGTNGLRVVNSSNITIEGCVVRDVWGTALRIDGDTTNMRILGNELTGTGDGGGILVGCGDASCWMQDSLIQGNLIHDVQGHGINLQAGTQGVTVADNVIFRVRDDGLQLPDTQFGDQNVATGNAIWQTGDEGIYIWGPARVQNNVVFETASYGIFTRDEGDTLMDVQISHNTVARTDDYAAFLEDWYERPGLVFANNALSNSVGRGLYWLDPTTDPEGELYGVPTENFIRNNVVTGLVEGFDRLVWAEHVIPGGGPSDFVDIDNFDFYPAPQSRLRDVASPEGAAYIPLLDFNGANRDGVSPDVGAYEFDGTGNPGWVIQEGFKEDVLVQRGGSDFQSGGCCNKGNQGGEAVLLLPLLGLGLLRRRR